MRSKLRPPTDLSQSPRLLLAELAELIGEPAAAQQCASLLAGADMHLAADVLPYLGGRPARAVLEGRLKPEWARVWGARGLLYVWAQDAGPTVVAGLEDEAWRVAENCLKVATRREIGVAGPAVAGLAGHRLARVRAQAVRALGIVGDTEHVTTVLEAAADSDRAVRVAADRALRRLTERLDLSPLDLENA